MSDISLDEATLWHVEHEGMDITDSVSFHGPPGTGKTTTGAATVGRLIRDHEYDISDVAWVTYRRSLARDTLERLESWGVLDEHQLDEPRKGATRYIATAHAVGNRCGDIGEEPVSGWQRADWCDRMDMQFWTSEPWEDSAGKLLFRVFDYLANANRDPTDTEALHACSHLSDLRDHWGGDVVDAWYQWQDYKAQRDLIDFHEMLSRPLEQGDTPGRKILVVDEYHDVTRLMHDLFQMWMEDAEIVIAAGDPHQVVNAYDGASPEYFEGLDLPQVLLPRSWRCREEHWSVATSMLAKSHTPPAVDIEGQGFVGDYNSPRFEYSSDLGWVTLPAPDEPASPGQLLERHDGSTLFLARTQMQADGIGAALEQSGVPYLTQKELNGWNTDDGATRLHLHNALQKLKGYTADNFGYGDNAAFSRFSGEQRDPRATELTAPEAATMLEAVNARTLNISRSDAEDRADQLRESEEAITLKQFDDWLTQSFWERYTAGSGSVDRLNKSVFGGDADRERLALRRALSRQDGPVAVSDIDTWAITIHASKGMEADDVVVYDGISNRILQEMRDNEQTRKNEHRTWYVALSRAKKRLHIMRGGFEWTTSIIPENLAEVMPA
jgi:DNA helicase-2/ATP-dependent DNA helicase PcrA